MTVWLVGNHGMLGAEVDRRAWQKPIDTVVSDMEIDVAAFSALQAFAGKSTYIRWIGNCVQGGGRSGSGVWDERRRCPHHCSGGERARGGSSPASGEAPRVRRTWFGRGEFAGERSRLCRFGPMSTRPRPGGRPTRRC